MRISARRWRILLPAVFLILNGCQNHAPEFHKAVDVTEDFHHRLIAGLFVPDREPVVGILSYKKKPPQEFRPAPFKYLRVSWELGSFWVQADKRALVTIYMDKETAFSHVHIAASKECDGVLRDFREYPTHPIQ